MIAHIPRRWTQAAATFAAFGALALAGPAAQAAPVTATFDGAVSGVSGLATQIINDHPVGTSVSWQLAFDDDFVALTAFDDVAAAANRPVTGSVTVGAVTYLLDYAHLFSYSYLPSTGEILSFQFQIQGSGPQSPSGGDFFGLWLRLDSTLALLGSSVGFGYSSACCTAYGYLDAAGDFSVSPDNPVPLPSTAWLVLPGLLGLALRRRRLSSAGSPPAR